MFPVPKNRPSQLPVGKEKERFRHQWWPECACVACTLLHNVFSFFFKAGFLCAVVLSVLELALYTRLAFNWQEICLPLNPTCCYYRHGSPCLTVASSFSLKRNVLGFLSDIFWPQTPPKVAYPLIEHCFQLQTRAFQNVLKLCLDPSYTRWY